MSSKNVISFRQVTKAYGEATMIDRFRMLMKRLKAGSLSGKVKLVNAHLALKEVNFAIRAGERVGVIGPNGAGKSTILKLINGIIDPTSGEIEVCGSIGGVFEVSAGFQHNLTAEENVLISLTFQGYSRAQARKLLDQVFDLAELQSCRRVPFQYLSSGMQMRLGFVAALVPQPDIVLLDEVLAVGDMNFKEKSFQMISEYLNGKTSILVSHNMEDITTVCDRVLVIAEGGVAYDGPVLEGIEVYKELCEIGPPPKEEMFVTNPHGICVEPKARVKRADLLVNGHCVKEIQKGDIASCEVVVDRVEESQGLSLELQIKKMNFDKYATVLGTYTYATEDKRAEKFIWSFCTGALLPGQYFLEISAKTPDDSRHAVKRLYRHDFVVLSPTRFGESAVADFQVKEMGWT